MHAPESAKAIFLITLAAALAPFVGGMVVFGWRACFVLLLSVATCVLVEKLIYRVVRSPALLGRSHAYLTGVLLALTLPAFVPWYIPIIAGLFTTIIGKAIFGGVGHFVWQPALIGRLAVAVLFPTILNPPFWPVLAQDRVMIGDINTAQRCPDYQQWKDTPAPKDLRGEEIEGDGFKITPPEKTLRKLYDKDQPAFGCLAFPDDQPARAGPPLISKMPPVSDLVLGTRPGGIGETSVLLILIAGLYLIYRNYIKWQLPVLFLASALVVAAIAPVYFTGPGDSVRTVWMPFWTEGEALTVPLFSHRIVLGTDVGFVLLTFHLLSGQLILAAFFMLTEMTSRPITTGGQVIYAILAGAGAMFLTVCTPVEIPAYLAILGANTLTPVIDSLCRPRVFSKRK